MWSLLVVLSMPLVFLVKVLLPWISYWMILSPVWFGSEGLVWIITGDFWLNLVLPMEAPADSPVPWGAVPALGQLLCWGEAHGLVLAV